MGGPNSFGNQNSFGGMPPGGYGGYGGMADMYPNNAVNPNQQVPMQSGQGGQSSSKSDFGLEDLNFDPDTLIGADGTGEQTDFGNLEDVDADDLLSFLDPPPDLSTPPSSGASGQTPRGPRGRSHRTQWTQQHRPDSH